MKQLNSIGNKYSYEDQCLALLISMPDFWSNLITAISSSCGDKPHFQTIVGQLLNEEARRI